MASDAVHDIPCEMSQLSAVTERTEPPSTLLSSPPSQPVSGTSTPLSTQSLPGSPKLDNDNKKKRLSFKGFATKFTGSNENMKGGKGKGLRKRLSFSKSKDSNDASNPEAEPATVAPEITSPGEHPDISEQGESRIIASPGDEPLLAESPDHAKGEIIEPASHAKDKLKKDAQIPASESPAPEPKAPSPMSWPSYDAAPVDPKASSTEKEMAGPEDTPIVESSKTEEVEPTIIPAASEARVVTAVPSDEVPLTPPSDAPADADTTKVVQKKPSLVGMLKKKISFYMGSSASPDTAADAPTVDDLNAVTEKGESKFVKAPTSTSADDEDGSAVPVTTSSKQGEVTPDAKEEAPKAAPVAVAKEELVKGAQEDSPHPEPVEEVSQPAKAAEEASLPARVPEEVPSEIPVQVIEEGSNAPVPEAEAPETQEEMLGMLKMSKKGKETHEEKTKEVPTQEHKGHFVETFGSDAGPSTSDPAVPAEPSELTEAERKKKEAALPPPISDDELAKAPSTEELAARIRKMVLKVPWLPGVDDDPDRVPGDRDGDGIPDDIDPDVGEVDENGRPIPPPSSVPPQVTDKELLRYLQSVSLMNGEPPPGNGRKPAKRSKKGANAHGILFNLEHFDVLRWQESQEGDDGNESEGDEEDEDLPPIQDLYSNVMGGGIMLTFPLEPKEGDKVKLADVKVVQKPAPLPQAHKTKSKSITSMWGLIGRHGKKGKKPEEEKKQGEEGEKTEIKEGETMPTGATIPSSSEGELSKTPGKKLRTKKHRRVEKLDTEWIPSKTDVSFEAMWWGFKLYLPPPIMAILSEEQVNTVKIISMISSALTWFFSNIPIELFPIALRPALLVIQKIAPYISYIGTFISWSWGQIQSFDKGYGVILSATWILPVVLIPSTWKEENWPKDPEPPAPADPEPEPAEPVPEPSPAPAPADPTVPGEQGPEEPADPPPTSPAPCDPEPAPAPEEPKPDADVPNTPAPVEDPAEEPKPGGEVPVESKPTDGPPVEDDKGTVTEPPVEGGTEEPPKSGNAEGTKEKNRKKKWGIW